MDNFSYVNKIKNPEAKEFCKRAAFMQQPRKLAILFSGLMPILTVAALFSIVLCFKAWYFIPVALAVITCEVLIFINLVKLNIIVALSKDQIMVGKVTLRLADLISGNDVSCEYVGWHEVERYEKTPKGYTLFLKSSLQNVSLKKIKLYNCKDNLGVEELLSSAAKAQQTSLE